MQADKDNQGLLSASPHRSDSDIQNQMHSQRKQAELDWLVRTHCDTSSKSNTAESEDQHQVHGEGVGRALEIGNIRYLRPYGEVE